MPQLNASQSLLLKACFLPQGAHYFEQWLQQFTLEDLDYHTRALIPLLLNAVDVAAFAPLLHKKMMVYKRQAWLTNTLKFRSIRPALDALNAAGIHGCFLKGSAMMQYFYKDMSQRPEHADIDLLIPLSDFSKAMAVLKQNGFQLKSCVMWPAQFLEQAIPQNAELIKIRHAIHYEKGAVVIDLHWQISQFIKGLNFKNLQSMMLQHGNHTESGLFYLSLEMQLIHSAIHAAFKDHFNPSLTNIIDFCFLFNQNPDFKQLWTLSLQLGVLGYVKHMVHACRAYIDNEIYEQYHQIFKQKKFHISSCISLLVFSSSIKTRRVGQVLCFLHNNHYRPLMTLYHIKYYFGARSWRQLFNFVRTRMLRTRKG